MGTGHSKGPTLEDALKLLTQREQTDLSAAFEQLISQQDKKKTKSKRGADVQAKFNFESFKVNTAACK